MPQAPPVLRPLCLLIFRQNHERFAAATTAISPVQMAVNHEVANPGTKLACGAEVAFFPPVTGG
ncbi:MAG: molybdopterin synthase sulfur carrier subunit [Limnobacter sp.]|nr:molybdopterin synthase sulfur carrier subunit [Limnobacter sp.]